MRNSNLIQIFRQKKDLPSKGITFIKSKDSEEFVSYQDLYDMSLLALNHLQENGIKPKDEVVLQIDDNKGFLIVFWACLMGGIIPVPLSVGSNDHNEKLCRIWEILHNPHLVISERDLANLREYLADSGRSAIQSQVETRTIRLEEILTSKSQGQIFPSREDDIAFIQFSSGSTGNPKGVVLTHKNLIVNMQAISESVGYSESDSMLSWMPLTHDMGMIGFHLNPLSIGINQFLMPTNLFVRHPALWMDKASEHRASILCSPNFGYRYILKYLNDEERNWDLSRVRIIYNGAEPISAMLCAEFNSQFLKYGLRESAMCPVYGLAEASVAVSMSAIEANVQSLQLKRDALNPGDQVKLGVDAEKSATFINVGKVINYCSLKIADSNSKAVADEIIGRIHIKGDNVTSGYYHNALATEEVLDSDGWLNTGDLGFIRDGNLFITGRSKDIIFVNGQNYYPHDIEAEAESVPGIELNKIVVTGYFDDATQMEEAVIFVAHRGELEKFIPVRDSLKSHLNRVFGFEINKILPVKSIPRTTSGKLQRFKLLEKYVKGEFKKIETELFALQQKPKDADCVHPQNIVEQEILEIWKGVLNHDHIGVESNFFEIGGDSLKAADLSLRLQKKYGFELGFDEIFNLKTIRRLALAIPDFAKKEYIPIPSVKTSGYHPVSPFQKRLYYAWQLDKASIAYNVPTAYVLRGDMSVEKLTNCLRKIVSGSDSLRMSFHLQGVPKLKVHKQREVKITLLETEKDEWRSTLKKLIEPFDLADEPLYRFYLIEDVSIQEWLLFVDFHHIICDGHSVQLFAEKLFQLYNGTTPFEAVPYVDFLNWQSHGDKAEENDRHKKYWSEQLNDEISVLELPYDYKRPVVLSFEGKKVGYTLGKTTSASLQRLASKQNVTLHALMFTLYNTFISKYSGQENVIIGIPVSVRNHPDLQKTIGMFVNNLPIKSTINGDCSFVDLLAQTFQILKTAISHQDLPFDELLQVIEHPKNSGRSPLFDTMFVYQNMGRPHYKGDFSLDWFSFDPGYSKFDLSMEVFEDKENLEYAFEYSTSLFRDETISKLSEGFERLVQRVIEDPEIKIKDLSPLSDEEFQNFVVGYNSTNIKTDSFKTVQQLFEDQAIRNPSAIALKTKTGAITYAELNYKANRIASTLQIDGVSNGDLVGICLPKSPEFIMSVLGVLKSGAAYLPIDLDTPADRLKYILNNSRCTHLITDKSLAALDVEAKLEIRQFADLLGHVGLVSSPGTGSPNDLAYVIYTSGTSGRPKGVMIEQESLVNYIKWAAQQYVHGDDCSFAFYSSVSFDLTVTSIFTPLITGNKIVIYEEEDSEVLIEKVIKDNQVDVLKLTPSHLRLLLSNGLLSAGCKVRRFIVGGENLDTALAAQVHNMTSGNVEILNEYGPTEATVGCMIYKFNPEDTGKAVPIGRPISNTQIYLVDRFLKPVPVNVPGDIYIAGKGLARGYLFLDALTNDRFVENPFGKGKMYKTGDTAKRLPNENLEFIGRNDKQAKINGNRVELLEIESELIKFKNVKEAVVLTDSKNTNHILAYYVPETQEIPLQDSSVRNYLAERLPHYMIPKEFISVESIPLTRNGKIDVAKLQSVRSANSNFKKEEPKSEIERIFVKIWTEILGVDEVGVMDNFFELGGDSIKAVQISSRLMEEDIFIKTKDILTFHTIDNISRHALPARSGRQYEQGTLTGEFKPTPIQSWFFSQRFRNPNYFNQSVLFDINSPLDITILKRAFKLLIDHHDTLRVNYDREKHSFFYNSKHLTDEVVIEEFEVENDQTLVNTCNAIRGTFDISKSLLIKMALIKQSGETRFLFITAHHLIMDGMSWRIFLQDFHKAYLSLLDDVPQGLSKKRASFKTCSAVVNQLASSNEFENQRDYWNEIDRSSFLLPHDFVTDDFTIGNTKKVFVNLEKDMTDFLLRGANKPYNTEVAILLNAALVAALHQWSGLEEFIIEQENHGRHFEDLDTSKTIGWFTTMYPVKLMYKHDVSALIKSVKEILKTVPNNGIGYGISKFLGKDSHIHRTSEIRFNYLGQFGDELDNNLMSISHVNTGVEADPSNNFTANLEFNCLVADGEFQTEVIYNSKLFRESTANELAKTFINTLSSILSHLKNEDDLHFTPSDFSAVSLDDKEIGILFDDI